MKQKELAVVLGWVLVAGFIAAAVGLGPLASPAFAAPPAAKPEQLILAIGDEATLDGFDPINGWGTSGPTLFFSTLLRRAQDMSIVNDLATDYSVSEDRLTWKVSIRKDVVFSDGKPLTARDVAFTFNAAATGGGLVDLTVLDKAVATSDYEVELHLKRPQSTFLYRMMTLGIVPEHAYNRETFNRNPIGSGPYKFVRWDEGQQLIMESNPLYYGNKPQFERMVFLFSSEDAAFAAAKAGEVHLAAVPNTLANQTISGMQMINVKSVDNRGLMFPTRPNRGEKTADGYPIGNDVTSDVYLRRAVNYLIDRQALVEGVLNGYGTPAHTPVSGLPWEEPGAVIKDADPDTARAILAEGGWIDTDGDGILEKNGVKAEFSITYPASENVRQSLALAVSDMINEVGINTTVQGKSWDEIEELMHSQVILFGWGSHDQTQIYNLYHSSMGGQGWYNTGYYSNPKVDEYLDAAMAAATEDEANMYWRKAQWDGEGNGFATPGDAVWAWLVNLDHTYFVSQCLDIGPRQIESHGYNWVIATNLEDWKWVCD